MSQRIIVVGTDTDIGKSTFSQLFLLHASARGESTLGVKPLAAGCDWQEATLVNEDALMLQQTSSIDAPMTLINPIRYQAPISPNIAAQIEDQQSLTVQRLWQALQPTFHVTVDRLVIEGIGGVMVPLNQHETFLDLLVQLQLPVILVVGLRLGCLNHALMTAQVLAAHKINCLGWVANQLTPTMQAYQENIHTLSQMLAMPLLVEIPFQPHRVTRWIEKEIWNVL